MKNIFALVLLTIIFMPCLLVFTEGEDCSFTIYNVLGICYTAGLYIYFKRFIRKMKEEE